MKKLTTLVLLAGLVVSSVTGVSKAQAGEFIPNATFMNEFVMGSPNHMDDGRENFRADNKFELGFDYVASENLSGTFLIEVDQAYGSGEFDGSWTEIAVKQAYIDWLIPSTEVKVRMGMQSYALPSLAFGSAVFDTEASGVVVATPLMEGLDFNAFWLRAAYNGGGVDPLTSGHNKDDADMFGLVLDYQGEGFRVAPWVMYAMSGRNINNNGVTIGGTDYEGADNALVGLANLGDNSYDMSAWWIGASFELSMFEPFTFALDTYYSKVDLSDGIEATGTNVGKAITGADRNADYDGFFVGASASYKTDYGVPTLKAWYATGADENSNDIGKRHAKPAAIAPGFGATTIFFDDNTIGNDSFTDKGGANPAGTWGILLEWADMSFIDKLSHTARIAYIAGTNDLARGGDGLLDYGRDSAFELLDKDESVIEFNFNTDYEIYKNLALRLELGWLSPSLDQVAGEHSANLNDDIYRAAVGFTYTF